MGDVTVEKTNIYLLFHRLPGGWLDVLLYVGITDDLWGRLAEHRRSQHWWHLVDRVETYPGPMDRISAARFEGRLIRQLQPLFNEQRYGGQPWRGAVPCGIDSVVMPVFASGAMSAEADRWEAQVNIDAERQRRVAEGAVVPTQQ